MLMRTSEEQTSRKCRCGRKARERSVALGGLLAALLDVGLVAVSFVVILLLLMPSEIMTAGVISDRTMAAKSTVTGRCAEG